MEAKRVLSCAVSTIVVLVVSQAALGGDYGVGHVWHRESDWTVRPGADHGTTNGNPDDDSSGSPVWSYEFYNNVPGDSNLDSANPWFTLASAGPMVWDSDWSDGVWARYDDAAPVTRAERMLHVNAGGSQAQYDEVPLVRWINPCGERIRVSITSGPEFGVTWHDTWGVLDAVIAKVDASEANAISILYSIAVTKPTSTQPETLLLPSLNIDEFDLDPGDEILFSIRSRTTHAGDTWKWVYLRDDVAITIVPEPGTLSLLCLGAAVVMRRRRRNRFC